MRSCRQACLGGGGGDWEEETAGRRRSGDANVVETNSKSGNSSTDRPMNFTAICRRRGNVGRKEGEGLGGAMTNRGWAQCL